MREIVQSEMIVKKERLQRDPDRNITISIQDDYDSSPSLYGSPLNEAQRSWKCNSVNGKAKSLIWEETPKD